MDPIASDIIQQASPDQGPLNNFRRFYEDLDNKNNIFYMFFTDRLLHWVFKTLSFIPKSTNIVLIGSSLGVEDRNWVESNINLPFFHIEHHVDDKTTWEYLFEVNHHHFGWIDIDCFVFNERLFDEMTLIADDAVANCIWSYSHCGLPILNTYFLFLNIDVRNALREQGLSISPCTFDYEGTNVGRTEPKATSKVITTEQMEVLRQVLPVDEQGRPIGPNMLRGKCYFDTMTCYQLLANAVGYRLNQVRSLSNSGQDASRKRSDELLHVGGVSWFFTAANTEPIDPSFNALYLQANLLLLDQSCYCLPPRYTVWKTQLMEQLGQVGLSMGEAVSNVNAFLRSRGLDDAAVDRMLSTTTPPK